MGKKKSKNPMPKLLPAGSAGSSSGGFFRVAPGSGAVTLAPGVQPEVPKPAVLPGVPTEPAQRLSRGDRKRKAAETAGADWDHMRAPTLTSELKRDLLVVKMRGVLDPKRFYRASDSKKGLPKYFQVGTMIEGAEDGREHKLTRKARKGSILDELLSDDAIRKRAKSQFLKSQAVHAAGRKRTVHNRGPAKRGGGKRHK